MNSERGFETPTYFVVPRSHSTAARFGVNQKTSREQSVFRPASQGHLRYGRARD
jgi:hypothetical protein